MLQLLATFFLAALNSHLAQPAPAATRLDVLQEIWNFDIQAPSCPNPFNSGSHELISMTLVGTAQHDVADIDPATIKIWSEHCAAGPVTPLRYNYDDKTTPVLPGPGCDFTSQAPDGILDLNVQFRKTDVQSGLGLGSCAPGTFVRVFVSAKLMNGCGIFGLDCVRVQ